MTLNSMSPRSHFPLLNANDASCKKKYHASHEILIQGEQKDEASVESGAESRGSATRDTLLCA